VVQCLTACGEKSSFERINAALTAEEMVFVIFDFHHRPAKRNYARVSIASYRTFHLVEALPALVHRRLWAWQLALLDERRRLEQGRSIVLIESAIRLAFASTLSTFTLTIWPVFTARGGFLDKTIGKFTDDAPNHA